MIKRLIKIILIFFLILTIAIFYLSIFGIKTTKFNNQIKSRLLESNKRINLDLKKIKMTLSPLDFKVNIGTLDTEIVFENKKLVLNSLKTKISLLRLLKNQFSIDNLRISSKSIKAKNLVSLIRVLKNEPKLLLLEMMIKEGYLEGNIDLNFDKEGKIKNDYKINGFVKNLELKILKKYHLENSNFILDIEDKKYRFKEIDTQFNKIKLNSPSITIIEKDKLFSIKGKISNNEKNTPFNAVKGLLNDYFLDLGLMNLDIASDNNFSFDLSKKFKLSNLNISSEINIGKLTYKNKFQSIKKYFPKIKDLIDLKDHKIKLNYNKDKIKIVGAGQISIEDDYNKIKYEITRKNNKYFFKKMFEINNDVFLINELKYFKERNKKASIKIDGILSEDKRIFFNEISLIENDNKILIKDLNLNNKFKISEIGLLKLNYEDRNKIYNQIDLKKNKKNYTLEGNTINASKIINKIMNSKNDDPSIFGNLSTKINVNIKKIYIDEINYMNNLSGNFNFKNNKINNLNLQSIFSNNKKFNLSIETNSKKEKITKLFTDYPKPLIKRYDFIKGFEEGYLDYYSIKKDGISNSSLVIDNFKVKEVPIFAKLLSLASLQGVADLLTGEGIRFTDFEMQFSNNNKGLTTIKEMYAIGPAVSILMDGYIESKKIVSLRGTLVPATTINRTIASIPFLGKILVGDKTGEGVFGVSFKIKGTPKNLKTSVNPVKTLTPRFITRTLEKIKKN